MEIPFLGSFADLEMMDDDPLFFQQCQMDSPDELMISSEIASLFSEDFHKPAYCSQQQLTPVDFKSAAPESSQFGENMPLNQLKTTAFWNSCEPLNMSSSDSSNFMNNIYTMNPCQDDKTTVCDNNVRLSQAQDNISAERKRRQNLNQRFIALSALVPGLKKMDKATILGDAIEHIKQLQHKVKTLEEQTTKNTIMESTVYAIKTYELYADNYIGENNFSDEIFSSAAPIITESFPLIEARFCNKDVLISIHCEKGKGVVEKIVGEIEKLHLSVVNSSVMTYGESALNITVIAEKDGEFIMSMKELVNNLRCVLKIFM